MILGAIDAYGQAVIPLQLRDPNGQAADLQVIVDTGFSGYLTLTPTLIAALQLPFKQRQTFTLGDDSDVTFDVYLATVLWDGQSREVPTLAANGDPLIGMKMLKGYRYFMDVVDGGEVRIEARS